MPTDSRRVTLLLALALLGSVWAVVYFAGPPAAPQGAAGAAIAPPPGTTLKDRMADGGSGPTLVVIPPGRFTMGAAGANARPEEQPVREVVLPAPLAVARTETTVAEFARFVAAAGYRVERGCWHHTADGDWKENATATWLAPGFEQADDHPVTCINHRDASVYAAWVSQQTGQHYRLPSEAEFEYFSRAGEAENLPAGQHDPAAICRVANGADVSSGLAYAIDCNDGYPHTSPVASFAPNAFGLFDTSGNLWEFTLDCWNPGYGRRWRTLFTLPPADGSPWMRGDCRLHVLRGGAYLSSADDLRLARREHGSGALRVSRSGFRLVREL